MMSPRELVKLAHDLSGKSDQAIDEALRVRHLDPSTKIAVKHEIAATAQQRTMAARLSTDDAEWHPGEQPMQPLNEIERLMSKAGLQPTQQYSVADIQEACRRAGIEDPSHKLAIKLEAEQRGMLKPRYGAQERARLYGKSMQASADERPARKQVLRDPSTGKAAVLRFLP
jgi:hypothetical protein